MPLIRTRVPSRIGKRGGARADDLSDASAQTAHAPHACGVSLPIASLRVALAAVLAFSLVPLAGCARDAENDQTPAAPATGGPRSASEDPGGSAQALTIDYDTSTYVKPEEKWADFDDGSPALDIAQTHLNANARTQTISVALDQGGAFAEHVAPEDIELSGGIADWKVESVSRVSDTAIDVVIVQAQADPAQTAGTAIAGVLVSERALVLPEPEVTEQDEALLEEYRKAEQAGELADEIREDGAPSSFEGEDYLGKRFYEVLSPFVHPTLLLDVADTKADADATVYRIIANEFAFPESLSANDFSLVTNNDELAGAAVPDAVEPEIVGVERLGDFEIDVTVAGDGSAPGSVHNRTSLILSGDASGTGGDVSCPLSLPAVWIDAEISQVDGVSAGRAIADGGGAGTASLTAGESAGQPAQNGELERDLASITLDVRLHNALEAPDAEEIQTKALAADGTYRDVPGAKVSVGEDGVAQVVLDVNELAQIAGVAVEEAPTPEANADEGQGSLANALTAPDAASAAIVTIDLPTAPSAYGGEEDPEAASLCVPLTAQSFSTLSTASAMSFDVGSIATSGAKSILSMIASQGWSLARNYLFKGTVLAEVTNRQLLSSIESMQNQINALATTLNSLSSKETAHYYANIVNNTNRVIGRIQAQYAVISGPYEAAVKLDGDAREEALGTIVANNKETIDRLLVDMSEFYTIITKADAASGMGIVGVYDAMSAAAYNWAAAAAPERIAYRDTLTQVWTSCVTSLYALLGTPAYAQAYSGSLSLLQQQSKAVDTALTGQNVVETTHTRAADTFSLAGNNSFVTATGKAYYCYTTNEWYAFCTGNDSKNKWNLAFFKSKKYGKTFDYDATNPFISWHNKALVPSWESLYMGTAQAKLLLGRSPENRSLQAEIRLFAESAPKYLITSSSFNMSAEGYPKNLNVWSSDTFTETAANTRSTYESGAVHFDGYVLNPAFKKATKTTVSSTEPEDMFVIAKVTLKD